METAAALYLQVSATGTKSWLFRYKVGGRSRYMGLGSKGTVTLAEARGAQIAARYESLAADREKKKTFKQFTIENGTMVAKAMTYKRPLYNLPQAYRHPYQRHGVACRQYFWRLDRLSQLEGRGEHGDAQSGDRSHSTQHYLRGHQSRLGID